jgi:inner membrane protein
MALASSIKEEEHCVRMEPITHFLTGACIGRTGFNRKTRYATLVAALAAEAADIDILWGFAGPVEELKHHRGFTHTFLGAPLVAGAVVGVIALVHFWREKRRARVGAIPIQDRSAGPMRARQPVRWWWLYVTALIAALSHILLDFGNNYGVRPFFPLNPHWYAGSYMFIVDPIVLMLLVAALVLPWIFGLTDREIGVRRKPFRGRGWAIFALSGFAVMGCLRAWQHEQAITLASNADITATPVERIAAEPYPVNPFHWHVILETASYYRTAEVNTWAGTVESDLHLDTIYKPAETPAVEAAKQTFLGRVYLDWGTWAVVRDMGQELIPGLDPPQLPAGQTWTTVEFSDLRFRYSFLANRGSSARAPLSGWVYIVDGHEDAGEVMDGRQQH